MTDTPHDSAKLIIDEDWKSQVEAEREALRRQRQADVGQPRDPTPDPASGPTPAPPNAAGAHATGARGPLPPATLPVLCTMLATQAMLALGQVPDPAGGQPAVDLAEARHCIDLLGMLEQKTAGNRTADEERLLTDLLHELRMAFVAIRDGHAWPPREG